MRYSHYNTAAVKDWRAYLLFTRWYFFSSSSPHFPLGILEAVCDIVDGLILGDGVCLFTGDRRLELSNLRLARQAIFQLSKRGEKSGTVGLDITVLAAQTKLDGEPVALKTTTQYNTM